MVGIMASTIKLNKNQIGIPIGRNCANRCRECNGVLVQMDHELICNECGLVIESDAYFSPFNYQENQNNDFREGQFVSMGNAIDNPYMLGTEIGGKFACLLDINGNIIKNQHEFKILKHKYSLRVQIKHHETEYRIKQIIRDLCQQLDLGANISQRTAYLYMKAVKAIQHIKNNVILAASCLYQACREYNRPITIQQIIFSFKLNGHYVTKSLIMRNIQDLALKTSMTSTRFGNFISMWISGFRASQELAARILHKSRYENPIDPELYFNRLERISNYFLGKTLEYIPQGSNPINIAAGCILAASKWIDIRTQVHCLLTQALISRYTKITHHAIRDVYVKYLKSWMSGLYSKFKFAQKTRMTLR